MRYKLRQAQENQVDLEKLIKLLMVFANEQKMGSLSASNLNFLKGVQWVVMNLKCAVWVVEDESGEFVGSIGLNETTAWYSDVPYLADGWFYVLPEHRASKVGTELLDAAKAFAKDKQMPLLVGLFNMEQVEAKVEMMKRKGFMQVGGLFLAEG